MRSIYDVAIVGGGLMGSSIAYQLSKRGKKVVLLEKGRLASQASGAAAGMIAAQAEMGFDTGPLFDLAIKSRAMFPVLAAELKELCGIDVGLVRKGMLKIACSLEEEEALHREMVAQKKEDQRVEWLTQKELRIREPGLSDSIRGAIYLPDDGQVLAPELSLAFARAAAILGTDIREFVEVESLVIDDNRISGVVTNHGQVTCEQVIVTAGSWSGRWLERMEIRLPVYPVKGECFSVLTPTPLLESTIFSHGCYLVPKRGGRLVVGATMIENTYNREVTVEGIATLIEKAKRLLPGIVHAEWEKAWTGLRPQTPDGLPYLGEHHQCKGLFVATGHFRNGVLLSPITGELMADLMEGKNPDGIDLRPFQTERFTG
ncbi:glycine oxidase ThiO [Ammoniphilus sp. 3BR4]|uniref:glycine oxidase ThiO n=1 Tax=Ammoniphilus sp. 3BR4 TaxID=3158265 RepID=UPI003465AD57